MKASGDIFKYYFKGNIKLNYQTYKNRTISYDFNLIKLDN